MFAAIWLSPISSSTRGDEVRIHAIMSPLQSAATEIRVLVPDELQTERRYPVVYVLPVEAGREDRYGDGLLETRQHNLHNQQQAIFVAPTFSQLPWYADHPSEPDVQQESYVLDVVIPLVDMYYPVSDERYLLGFSKSGWGAWTLLLRHPETFCRAAAWDAPLMMQELGKYGTAPIFGTQANFERYRPADLLRSNAATLRKSQRLILAGYGNFRTHHEQAHALLNELQIPHAYLDGPARRHDWHSGWVPQIVPLLLDQVVATPDGGRRDETPPRR